MDIWLTYHKIVGIPKWQGNWIFLKRSFRKGLPVCPWNRVWLYWFSFLSCYTILSLNRRSNMIRHDHSDPILRTLTARKVSLGIPYGSRRLPQNPVQKTIFEIEHQQLRRYTSYSGPLTSWPHRGLPSFLSFISVHLLLIVAANRYCSGFRTQVICTTGITDHDLPSGN